MSYIGTGVETVTFNTATTLDVAGNITLGGTVDGRDVATDGTKLDTITSGAIADLLQDTTPQLGGNLDLNTSNVIGTGNINVTGSITGTSFVSTGNMSFTNNSKAIFGTSPSLEIYHDGSNSILDDVGAGNFKMQLAGADKLEITSTGVDVTGTVTADGLTVDTSDQVIINHSADGGGIRIDSTNNTNTGSLRFGDAADNYIGAVEYNHSTDALSLYANNATRMTISSAGNVGIGTTNPGMLLDVDASGSGANDIARFSGRNSAGLTFRNATSQDFIIHTATSDALIFGTNGNNERMRITSSGNVGIGQSNPAYLLTAEGDKNTWISRIYNTGSDANAAGLLIRTDATAAHDALAFGVYADSGYKFVVRSSGNVGIGTTTPATKLEVSGAVSSTGTGAGNAAFKLQEASNNPWYLMQFTGGAFSLNYNGTTGGASKLLVDSSGNLIVGGTYASAPGSIMMQSDGDITGMLASGAGGNTLISAISGVSNGYQISVDASNNQTYKWHNGGAQSMTLDSSGNVGIGSSASLTNRLRVASDNPTNYTTAQLELFSNSGHVYQSFHAGGATAVIWKHPRGSNVLEARNNADSGYININANAFAVQSDYRLKENIVPISNATERLKKLNPVRFNFKAFEETGEEHHDNTVDGFLAHEVQAIVPEAITGTKDAVDEDGNPVYQGIDQSKLVPLLVKTIQELEARIAALENT